MFLEPPAVWEQQVNKNLFWWCFHVQKWNDISLENAKMISNFKTCITAAFIATGKKARTRWWRKRGQGLTSGEDDRAHGVAAAHICRGQRSYDFKEYAKFQRQSPSNSKLFGENTSWRLICAKKQKMFDTYKSRKYKRPNKRPRGQKKKQKTAGVSRSKSTDRV